MFTANTIGTVKLRISLNKQLADKNSPKQFVSRYRETTVFFVEVNNSLRQVKGKLIHVYRKRNSKSLCCSINQSINQSIIQSINQSINQLINQLYLSSFLVIFHS